MPNVLNAQGLSTATQAELLTYFTTQMQNIYGADINLSSDTADGQLINIFIQSILDLEDLLTQIYNSFDPDLAIGNVLDQRVAINGIQRQAGTFSVTNITITTSGSVTFPGLDQTAVPAYTVSDNAGNQWQLQYSQIEPLAGTYIFTFQAATPGAITTVPNTINVPVTILPNVSVINNPTIQTYTGLNEESDAALRVRRQQSVSFSSQGYLAGLIAALENINGVTGVFVYENRGSTTDPVTGVPGHSIWVIVAGTPAPALSTAWSATTSYQYGQIASLGGINYISWTNGNLNNTPPNPSFWGVYNPIAMAIYYKRNAGAGMFGQQSYTVTQIDGTQIIINWDIVVPQNLFIQFTATSINGVSPPNLAAILSPTTGLSTIFTPGVFSEVNVNQLATLVQSIDPNTLVTFGAVPPLPFLQIFPNGGLSAALNQTIIFFAPPTVGAFELTYNGNSTTPLPFTSSTGAIQTALQLLPGLSNATVTGSLASSFLTINLGVSSALGLIYVTGNTTGQTITYNEIFQNIVTPSHQNYQFAVLPQNIIITPMIFVPVSAVVPHTQTFQFTAYGGYGTISYSVITSGSGAPSINSSGLYTAGGTAGMDVIQASDFLGNVVTANITVT